MFRVRRIAGKQANSSFDQINPKIRTLNSLMHQKMLSTLQLEEAYSFFSSLKGFFHTLNIIWLQNIFSLFSLLHRMTSCQVAFTYLIWGRKGGRGGGEVLLAYNNVFTYWRLLAYWDSDPSLDVGWFYWLTGGWLENLSLYFKVYYRLFIHLISPTLKQLKFVEIT